MRACVYAYKIVAVTKGKLHRICQKELHSGTRENRIKEKKKERKKQIDNKNINENGMTV